MKKIVRLILLICILNFSIYESAKAQYTGNVWCFGDSAGINFNTNPPSSFVSGMLSRGGSASISDSNGNLLFYVDGGDNMLLSLGQVNSGVVRSRNHQVMMGGDTLIGHWYHDMIIVPKSLTDSTFYIFTAGNTNDYGLYYNLIDLKRNNGLGEVIQKNIQLQSFAVFDGLCAVKHGNGKDWWLIFQQGSVSGTDSSDSYYLYLIDSSGIGSLIQQQIGGYRVDNGGDLTFSLNGDKILYSGIRGLVEVFDFDRCSGIISNPVVIETEKHVIFPYYFSSAFSPDSRFIYLASYNSYNQHQDNYLYQLDLQAANIAASKIIIDSFPDRVGLGHMELGPDGKIYISIFDEHYNYPFPDTAHTNITDYLSVINSPDSLGAACDFQPFSFYLGGRRTYYGLPNNPDYTLGALTGSPCDTITAIEIHTPQIKNELKVYYQHDWDVAFINAEQLKGKTYRLELFELSGKIIYSETGRLSSQYFTRDLQMLSYSEGLYIVSLTTDKEKLVKKFLKN